MAGVIRVEFPIEIILNKFADRHWPWATPVIQKPAPDTPWNTTWAGSSATDIRLAWSTSSRAATISSVSGRVP